MREYQIAATTEREVEVCAVIINPSNAPRPFTLQTSSYRSNSYGSRGIENVSLLLKLTCTNDVF